MPRAERCWRGGTVLTSWSDGAAPTANGADRASWQQASRGRFRSTQRAARGEPTRRCARGVGSQRPGGAPGGAAVGPLQACRARVDEAGEADAGGQSAGVVHRRPRGSRTCSDCVDHAQRPPDSNPADLPNATTMTHNPQPTDLADGSPSAYRTVTGAGV